MSVLHTLAEEDYGCEVWLPVPLRQGYCQVGVSRITEKRENSAICTITSSFPAKLGKLEARSHYTMISPS